MSALTSRVARFAALVIAAVALPALQPAPATAAARVAVANADGDPVIDATYATTLTVRGSGFQSIRNGHGGIYVLFGTVSGAWRPSAGGNGTRLTVPDAETKNNAGYAKFIAFPGGDTAGSANGGTIAADGSWSTTLAVPGAEFTTIGPDGGEVEVDCRAVTCGVITIGAHGVANARNETFTPVRVGDLYAEGGAPAADGSGAGADTTAAASGTSASGAASRTPSGAGSGTGKGRAALAPALEVDRASAHPGRVLAFSASGLEPGIQVSATFADGQAGVGPLTVGVGGQVSGVLQLPADLDGGTYELRLVGPGEMPSVRFAVVADEVAVAAAGQAEESATGPVAFAVAGAVAVAAAVALLLWRRRRAR